jgi:hypothetical protein
MFKNHLFNVLIATALIITLAFTVQEALATTAITSWTDREIKCADLPSSYSIHSMYEKELGRLVTYTEDGPTGVDGGLIHLLSSYRTCSR